MFRHFWADFDNQERDTMEDGWKSCAFFVTSLLTMFGALDRPHSTVKSSIEALEKYGWQKVTEPKPGDVLIWEDTKPTPDDEAVPHVGFYIGQEQAVSTSWQQKTPIKHDWLFRDFTERAVTVIYRGKHLMPDDIKITEN